MCRSTYKELNNPCDMYLGIHIYIVCLACASQSTSSQPCTLLLVSVALAFGTIGHVQQSVRTGKRTLKEFKEVSEVSNTSLKQRYVSFSRQPCVSLLR